MKIATMDRVGRLVLPSEVRELLHLEEGARFQVDVVAGRVELVPEENSELVVENGVLILDSHDAKKRGKPGGVRAAIKADREERVTRIGGARRR